MPLMIMINTHTLLSLIVNMALVWTNAETYPYVKVNKDMIKARYRRNRKTIRMMVMFLVTFFIIWTPYLAISSLSIISASLPPIIRSISTCMCMSLMSMCVNFLVYVVFTHDHNTTKFTHIDMSYEDTIKSFFQWKVATLATIFVS